MDFFLFAKNISKNIGKSISKKLSGKYSQKLLDHAKKSATDALRISSKRIIQKTAEATSHLGGNKIANKITKVSKTSQQNNSETVTNEHEKEIGKERCISPEERQEIIDVLVNSIIMEYKKTAEATGVLTGNKIASKITGVSKNSQQNNYKHNHSDNYKQLKISMIKKYLKKDIYFQKKHRKLLII